MFHSVTLHFSCFEVNLNLPSTKVVCVKRNYNGELNIRSPFELSLNEFSELKQNLKPVWLPESFNMWQ